MLFLAELDDGVMLNCFQLRLLLLGGLELSAQPLQLGWQILVFLEGWFNLVEAPFTVLRRLHDILQGEHSIIHIKCIMILIYKGTKSSLPVLWLSAALPPARLSSSRQPWGFLRGR
jgi:hypothetical protein